MMNRIWLGIAIATFINTIFALISLATPHWFYLGNDGSKGLWQICTRGVCTSLLSDNIPVSYHVVQACFTLGFISMFCALVTSALLMFDKGKPNYYVILISMACFFLFFSMIYWTRNIYFDIGESYGDSYILGWVASTIGIILIAASSYLARKQTT